MTNEEMAQSDLKRAKEVVVEAEMLYKKGVWNLVVRRSQEAVELALKGALRFAGLEVPKVHDVGAFLIKHKERLSGQILEKLPSLASISRRLELERKLSFYGDEETATPPEKLYGQVDADQAMGDARFVLEACTEFIERPGED